MFEHEGFMFKCGSGLQGRHGRRRDTVRAQGSPFFIKGDGSTGQHRPCGREVYLPGLVVGSVADKHSFARRGLHLCSALGRNVDISRRAKHSEVLKIWLLAGDGLKRGNGGAGAAGSPVEDMNCRGHGKLPVANCELSM